MTTEADYSAIERTLDSLQAKIVPQLQEAFLDAREKIKGLVDRRMRSGGLDFKFINGLELRGLGSMTPLLRAYLQETYRAGQAEADREMARWKARSSSGPAKPSK